MTPSIRIPRALLPALLMAGVAITGLLIVSATGQGGSSAVSPISRDDTQTCLSCHSPEMAKDAAKGKVCNSAALAVSPHKDLKCQDCHIAISGVPHTPEMLKQKVTCATCHSEQMDAYLKSVHSNKDIQPGDHPTCISCHANGDPHAVTKPGTWSRPQKVALCSQCHEQKERMARYHVKDVNGKDHTIDPEAVSSYNESFHGKALLRFGMTKAAICTDCHRNHDVLAPTDPNAPTNPAHVAATCGQTGCHAGVKMNFAMSGANHFRLKVKQNPMLHLEELLFQWLTVGTIIVLIIGIALDLRVKIFTKGPGPESGKTVGLIISISFLCLVTALLLAWIGAPGAPWSALAAIILMAVALLIFAFKPKQTKVEIQEKTYQRFSLAQRAQHICLAISFTLLCLTGLPLRFAHVPMLANIDMLFGGLAGARILHRCAAVVMITTWIWHTLFLLIRWKRAGFTMRSWTMWPSFKDFRDVFDVVLHYAGIKKDAPKYERFQFREKFDYFAVYWGMPIMVFSGLVLWFPVYFGNQLPDTGIAVAYIAHSDEAILAFLAIVVWHFYNTHFNPDHFPMSKVWFAGTLSRTEMIREHPLELERLEKKTEISDE